MLQADLPDETAGKLERAFDAYRQPFESVVDRLVQACADALEEMGFMVEQQASRCSRVNIGRRRDDMVDTVKLFDIERIIRSKSSLAQIRNGMIRNGVEASRYVNSKLSAPASDMRVFEQFTTDVIGDCGIDNYETFEEIKWNRR